MLPREAQGVALPGDDVAYGTCITQYTRAPLIRAPWDRRVTGWSKSFGTRNTALYTDTVHVYCNNTRQDRGSHYQLSFKFKLPLQKVCPVDRWVRIRGVSVYCITDSSSWHLNVPPYSPCVDGHSEYARAAKTLPGCHGGHEQLVCAATDWHQLNSLHGCLGLRWQLVTWENFDESRTLLELRAPDVGLGKR